MKPMRQIRNITTAAILALTALFSTASAQDLHLSQLFSNSLYINPAFAGASCGSVTAAYRNQWTGIGGGFSLATVSYDQYIKALHGGIGAYVNADFQGGNNYRDISASIMYSFRAQFGKSLFLTLAVQGSYYNRYVDWNSLTFPDQYDPYLGLMEGRPTEEKIPQTPLSKHYGDVGVGATFYGRNFYVGFSAVHLNMPDVGFMGVSRMDIRYSAQAGGRIYFKKSYNQQRDEKDICLSPNIVYVQQGKFSELNYGLYVNVWPMVAGVWFRQSFSNPDAVIFLVGADLKGVRISYSYDLTVSKLTPKSGGSHEISLGFRLPCPKEREGYRSVNPIPCPKF